VHLQIGRVSVSDAQSPAGRGLLACPGRVRTLACRETRQLESAWLAAELTSRTILLTRSASFQPGDVARLKGPRKRGFQMSDRKYRQRGYQDDPRKRGPQPPKARAPQERAPGRQLQDERGPKTPNLMAAREVFRCARCGHLLSVPVGLLDRCSRCGVDVHACIQCMSFDTSVRWECTQHARIPARIVPKDERNPCDVFTPRTTVERQTSTSASGGSSASAPSVNSAKKAFDDLFK
jgi:hypothetical protein